MINSKHYRCGNCSNCKEWTKQKASYEAAMSEVRDDKQKYDGLIASYNALRLEF